MHTPYIVNKGMYSVLDIFGPTVEFLTSPAEAEAVYCVMLMTTTPQLGRFFQEIGRPVTPGVPPPPPTPEERAHFMRLGAQYHHWLGSPADNAAVGISLVT